MNVLITGGAGFIGSHLAEHHLHLGDHVLAVDDLSTGSMDNLHGLLNKNPSCRFIEADLLTWQGLDYAVGHTDLIYHMAAVVGMFRVLEQPVEVIRVNILGTERVLNAIARSNMPPTLVIASSSSVYGHTHGMELHEDIELVFPMKANPLAGYALSKLTNELQAAAYKESYNVATAIPRLFNAVGPRQSGNYGFVLPRFISQAINGEPLTVFGDGSQTRSFCDVRDTVSAMNQLACNPACWGRPVNIGNPHETSILDLANLVVQRSGSSSSIEFVPFEKVYGRSFAQILQRLPVLDTLQSLTPFKPAWTLEMTIDDLLERERANAGKEALLV